MIIARIESLILNAGLEDVLIRADAYICSGADGIIIHRRQSMPDEVIEFANRFKKAIQRYRWYAFQQTMSKYNLLILYHN